MLQSILFYLFLSLNNHPFLQVRELLHELCLLLVSENLLCENTVPLPQDNIENYIKNYIETSNSWDAYYGTRGGLIEYHYDAKKKINEMYDHIDSGYDLVIPSRYVEQGQFINAKLYKKIIIIHDAGNLYQSFNKNIFQFDEKAKPYNSGNGSIKCFSNLIHHELSFSKAKNLSFNGHGLDFHLCRLLGYFM